LLIRLDGLLKKYCGIATWLLILVAVVLYHAVLTYGFVFDDLALILLTPYIKNPHLWKQIFLGPLLSFAGPAIPGSFYRPLGMFCFWLVCRVAGLAPGAYHLFQLALYALAVWTVYRISRKLLPSELAAFAGALLWTLHPLHVEAVAWVSAIPDIGCVLFYLLAFWFFLRAEEHSPAGFRYHAVAAAVYFPALFFKEVAFSFPLLLLAYWFCFSSGASWLRRAYHWLPYVLAAAICAAIRVAVMGRFSTASPLRDLNPRVMWTAIGLLGQHAKLFFWPVHLSEFREFDLSASLHSPWPWGALLALAAACLWRKRDPLLSFLVLWWFVTLLPCLDYRQLSFPLVEDQFSYLPSVGLCLALGYLAFVLAERHFPKARPSRVLAPAVALVAVLWSGQIVRSLPHWRNNDALFAYSLRASPNASLTHFFSAEVLLFTSGDLNRAAREFQVALRLNAQGFRPLPQVTYKSYVDLGEIALMQGHESEALDYLNRAVLLEPQSNAAYAELGSMYFPRGDYARAAGFFQQAVASNPMDLVSRFFLGSCWLKLGKPAQAAEQFRAARVADPDYLQAYEAEARALEAMGDHAGAVNVRHMQASAAQ
jgi:Flp pilus assembly protein TadD